MDGDGMTLNLDEDNDRGVVIFNNDGEEIIFKDATEQLKEILSYLPMGMKGKLAEISFEYQRQRCYVVMSTQITEQIKLRQNKRKKKIFILPKMTIKFHE